MHLCSASCGVTVGHMRKLSLTTAVAHGKLSKSSEVNAAARSRLQAQHSSRLCSRHTGMSCWCRTVTLATSTRLTAKVDHQML